MVHPRIERMQIPAVKESRKHGLKAVQAEVQVGKSKSLPPASYYDLSHRAARVNALRARASEFPPDDSKGLLQICQRRSEVTEFNLCLGEHDVTEPGVRMPTETGPSFKTPRSLSAPK